MTKFARSLTPPGQIEKRGQSYRTETKSYMCRWEESIRDLRAKTAELAKEDNDLPGDCDATFARRWEF